MNTFQCLRAAARPASSTYPLLRPAIARTATPARQSLSSQSRTISLLALRRPTLPTTSSPSCVSSANLTPSLLASPTSAQTLDLLPKISSHPALAAIQVRCGPRDTYNPSHLVRKRRHGFLSRIRTKKGRKLLMRRLKKGRWNLSH